MTIDEAEQTNLIQRACSEPDAFAQLYLLRYNNVFNYCVRRLFDRHHAEDVTSTVFFKAMHSLDSFRGKAAYFRSWLLRIATNAVNDHLRDTKRRADIMQQITVSAWIKVNAFDTEWQAIVTKGDSAWRLQRNWNNNTIEFACSSLVVPGTRWGSVYGTADVNDGRWHHVAGTYDGSQNCLYADGKLDVSSTASGTIKVNDQPVYIGENSERPDRFWNGTIDDVRIYSYALNADEIAAIIQSTNILFFK